jgi:hypothetical protein
MFALRRGSLRWWSLVVLLLSASQSRIVSAQGTCVCQPGEITFTLNFDLRCRDSNVLTGDHGINETLCVEFPPINDTVPVSVSNISMSEVNSNFDVLKMVNYSDTFSTGDNITYISYAVTNTESVENGTIPYAFQVTITGENEAGISLTNSYAIVYTNDCSIYPVLEVGSQIGWTAVVRAILLIFCISPQRLQDYSLAVTHFLLSFLFIDGSGWTT